MLEKSEIYWVAIRFMGLFFVYKLLESLVQVIANGYFLIRVKLIENVETLGTELTGLSAETVFIPALIRVLLYIGLAYYVLRKGEMLHKFVLGADRASILNKQRQPTQ